MGSKKHHMRFGKHQSRPRRSPKTPNVSRPDGPLPYDVEALDKWDSRSMGVCRDAADVLLAYRTDLITGARKPDRSAESVVQQFIDEHGYGRLEWKTMLNVTLAIAQADPRYFGVSDPVTQQQCVACGKVKDLKHFRHLTLKCEPCEDNYASV